MGNCELCGKEDKLSKAIVEGSMLNVCSYCIKFGHVIEVKSNYIQEEKRVVYPWTGKGTPNTVQQNDSIVPNYPELVKKAREKKELTQEKLGQAIAERESLINKIEGGYMSPNLKVAKKLEVFLGIKLIIQPNEEKPVAPKKVNIRDDSLTIGDLLDISKKE